VTKPIRHLGWFACFLWSSLLLATIPDGAVAPDWTLVDIHGKTHRLYEVLEAGKPVVLSFNSTWCPPCKEFHNKEILKDLYLKYGPQGTDEIMVYFIEGDLNTPLNSLYGEGVDATASLGDWIEGTPYPIINIDHFNGPEIIGQYDIQGWPTVLAISPDKRAWSIGQSSLATIESWIFESFPLTATYQIYDAPCADEGKVKLNTEFGHGELQYEWSNKSNQISQDSLEKGYYSVRITDTNGYFIDLKNLEITGASSGFPLGITEEVIKNPDCQGDANGALSINVTGGNGSYQFIWDNGETTPTIDRLPAGVYSVVVIDEKKCQVSKTFILEDPEPLQAFVSVVPTGCLKDSGVANFNISGGTGKAEIYLGNQPNPITSPINTLAAGEYTYQVKDQAGCVTEGIFDIHIMPNPQFHLTVEDTLSCKNNQVTVAPVISGKAPTSTKLSWTKDEKTISTSDKIEPLRVSQPGSYKLRITDVSSGCYSEDTILVESSTETPEVAFSFDPEINCSIKESILVVDSQSASDKNLGWSLKTENGTQLPISNLKATLKEAGNYIFSVENKSTGCKVDHPITVIQNLAKPKFKADPQTLDCNHNERKVCIQTDPANKIEWIQFADHTELCRTIQAAGKYYFQLTAPNGCTEQGHFVVTNANDLPQFTIDGDLAFTCELNNCALAVKHKDEASEGGYLYKWTGPMGAIIGDPSSQQISALQPGQYTVEVLKPETGCRASKLMTIPDQRMVPSKSFDYKVENGRVFVIMQEKGPYKVNWQWQEQQLATGQDTSFTLPFTGDFEICAHAYNGCGEHIACEKIRYNSRLTVDLKLRDASCFEKRDGAMIVSVNGGLPPYEIELSKNYDIIEQDRWDRLSGGEYLLTIIDTDNTKLEQAFFINQANPIEIGDIKIQHPGPQQKGSIEFPNLAKSPDIKNMVWHDGYIGYSRTQLNTGIYHATITNNRGCTTEIEPISLQYMTDLTKSPLQNLRIFPNPAYEFFNVRFEFSHPNPRSELNIKDLSGRVLIRRIYGELSVTDRIDVGSLPCGVYTAEIKTEQGIQNHRLIVVQ